MFFLLFMYTHYCSPTLLTWNNSNGIVDKCKIRWAIMILLTIQPTKINRKRTNYAKKWLVKTLILHFAVCSALKSFNQERISFNIFKSAFSFTALLWRCINLENIFISKLNVQSSFWRIQGRAHCLCSKEWLFVTMTFPYSINIIIIIMLRAVAMAIPPSQKIKKQALRQVYWNRN